MNQYCVYKICRTLIGNDLRHYIGVTHYSNRNNPNKRFKCHKKTNSAIGNFIKKYNDCEMIILFDNLTKKEALEIERNLVPESHEERKKLFLLNETGGGGYPPTFKELTPIQQQKLKSKRSEIQKQKWKTEKFRKKFLEKNLKFYKFISPNGEIFEGKGIFDFCKLHNLDYICMGRVLSGERKHHKGWSVP